MTKVSVLPCASISPYEIKENETYMNSSQLAHFRNILENWRNQLMQLVDSTLEHMRNDCHRYADDFDNAAQEKEVEMLLHRRERERKLIKNIERSLEWVSKGEYGYCDDCGNEIGIRRLEARPITSLCVDCKSIAEIKERQMRSS